MRTINPPLTSGRKRNTKGISGFTERLLMYITSLNFLKKQVAPK